MKAELLDTLGNDLTVVNAARVSLDKRHEVFDAASDTKLIKYLAREGHWTPFAQPQAQFRIKAPIFVARQWFRHTVGTVRSEVSRRYVDDTPTFFHPQRWRARPEGNIKQGSGGGLNPADQKYCDDLAKDVTELCEFAYAKFLDVGMAPEQARMILPQSLYTQWIETGSLSYWARLCTLRLDPHAQDEIRILAQQVAEQMAAAFPVSWTALMENAHE